MSTTNPPPRRRRSRAWRWAVWRWGARVGMVLACCLMGWGALIPSAPHADAHPLSTTAILLDVGADRTTGTLELPIDRLAIALDQPLTAPVVAQPVKLAELTTYVGTHIAAGDATTHAPWAVSLSDPRVGVVDGVDHFVVDVALTPPDATAGDLELRYDGIVHRLLSHRVLVSSRAAGTDDPYTAVGVLDWQSQTLDVPRQGASAEQGFLAAVALGVHHIGEGSDHLLFLLMLLLPAPLLARGGRWVRSDGPPREVLRGQAWRVVQVTTAFALGHSLTLALAALGYVSVPTPVVESLIAVSILVSGVHAVRPIVHGGEVWIAAVFGLMHGLAFASLLGRLDLGRGSLVTELLGFNVGIELAQLIVLALVMPSLVVLSRSRAYPPIRTALAGLGIVLAAGWLAQRSALVNTNPVEGVSDALVDHPLVVPALLALAALAVVVRARLARSAPAPPTAADPAAALATPHTDPRLSAERRS